MIRKIFQQDMKGEAYKLIRVRRIKGEAVILDKDYFVRDVVSRLPLNECKESVYRYLEEELGLKISYAVKEITVQKATPEDYELLDMEDYDMVVVVRSHTYLENNTLFQYTESRHRPDKFRSDDVTEGVFSLVHKLIGDLNHGMTMFHDWNLCLDETGGPNYVGNLCHAPYLFHREKKRLLPQPTLDCFYHVSHFIRPGSVRIAHSIYTDKIETTAYKREDGSIAMVCLNRTEKQLPVHLRINKKTAEFTLLPQSVTTCEISDL